MFGHQKDLSMSPGMISMASRRSSLGLCLLMCAIKIIPKGKDSFNKTQFLCQKKLYFPGLGPSQPSPAVNFRGYKHVNKI